MAGAGHAHAARGEAGAALRQLRAALDGWGGDPLSEDAYEEWAQEYRTVMARAHLHALEEAAAVALAVRDPAQAVAFAERAVAREPLRESAHRLLAQALTASGDSAAALQTVDRLRRRLVEELGVDVSADVAALERRILRGEALEPVGRGRVELRAPAAVEGLPFSSGMPFVGRDAEMNAILGIAGGSSRWAALVSGVGGIGKSRLLREVAMRAAVPVLAARAFLPERDEPWGLARALLREALSLDYTAAGAIPDRAAESLADIVPELAELRSIPGGPLDAESRRALALEGSVRLLETAARGAVLLVDDLQWADATSLGLLGSVAARVPEVGMVLAYRSEEVPRDGPVAAFLRDLPGLVDAVVDVPLQPLSGPTISLLVADAALASTIGKETDCTPLAVGEVLRALAGRGAIEPDPGGRWHVRTEDAGTLACESARAGQRRAIEVRVERQPASRRETLSLLALLGREAPARVLASAAHVDQRRVLDDLDVLGRAGLVRLGGGGWATAHDLIGETVVGTLDRAQRGRLHQMLAQALEAESGDPSELARHLAGAGDRVAAAAAFAEACRRSLEGFAAEETVRLADLGLEFEPEAGVRSVLLEARAEARALRGDLHGARDDLRDAVAATRAGPQRARLLARTATLISGSDLVRAGELVEIALTQAGTDVAARAEALAVAAMVDSNMTRLDRSDARSAEALRLFDQAGDLRGVASVLDVQANSAFFRGRIREAVPMYARAVRLYRDAGSLLHVGTPLGMRGLALTLMGRPGEAIADIEEALELERMLGQVEGECGGLVLRGEALVALGRHDEARRSVEEGAALARRLGNAEYLSFALSTLGLARQAGGDLGGAEAAFLEALEVGRDLPGYVSLASARLASLSLARGDTAAAEAYAQRCMAGGHPLWQYGGRLVRAELSLARGEPGAEAAAAELVAEIDEGGHVGLAGFARVTRLLATSSPSADATPAPSLRERKVCLFSDIVRSTNLVEALGDEAWGHLLRWHDETLRSLFASYTGREVKQVGDGFFVVFDRADSAVECAVAIQRALERHRREHGFSPQVRIGLHEAQIVRRGRDYQGRGVHEAARIGALAEGGEIVASRPLADGVAGSRVSEARRVTLRGISDAVEVVTIHWR